jgi:DNA polymerase III sliding clamp (beta) subunit (PCNA family)
MQGTSSGGRRLLSHHRCAQTTADLAATISTSHHLVGGRRSKDGAIAVGRRSSSRSYPAGEQVKLVLDDRALTITAASSRFKIHGLPAADFPTLPDVSQEKAVEIPFARVRKMVAKVLFAVSSESRPAQWRAARRRQGDRTGRHRRPPAALVEGDRGRRGRRGVLVPRKALQELQRFEVTAIAFRRGEHHLLSPGRELICRILEGTFLITSGDRQRQRQKAIFERLALADAVRRVALLTGDRRAPCGCAARRLAHRLDQQPDLAKR